MQAKAQPPHAKANDYDRLVEEFHIAFDDRPVEEMTPDLLRLRQTLIVEEVRELFAEMDAAIAATSSWGAVRAVCPSISTVPMERWASRASASHVVSGWVSGRARTSTSERAVICSSECAASTSKAATLVPK